MWNWLGFAIITQAVEDYKEYKRNGYPTDEIEEFLLSEWCNVLLENMKLTGEDILRFLQFT
jgi:hypothetical protein